MSLAKIKSNKPFGKQIIFINDHSIGKGQPVYIIAELSANHNQNFDQAVKLIKMAKEVGADAVKLQTFTPDTLTINSERKYFHINGGTSWDGLTFYDLYNKAYMPWEWQPKLKTIADDLGISLFSTAYDYSSIEFLEKMDVPAHKIASPEIVDIPLIEKMAATGKPLIISTGMATLNEITEALEAAKGKGAKEVILLKCTSSYPAPLEEMNLRTIPHLAEKFNFPIGLSDHSMGDVAAIASVALGACVIEKHLTLSRSIPGPDAKFSMEPDEFGRMVSSIRLAEKALGAVSYEPTPGELSNRLFRRSLFVVEDIKDGEQLTEKNIRSIRPGFGLPPKYLKDVLGKKALKDIQKGTPLTWDIISASAEPVDQSGPAFPFRAYSKGEETG